MPRLETHIRVAFDDCDPAGILFFANFFKLAHRAIEEFVISRGITWSEWFQNAAWAVPIKSAQSDYKRPLFAGRNYTLTVELVATRETSIQFQFQVLDEAQNLCIEGSTVHVFIDKVSGSKRPIPASVLKALTQDA